MKIDLFNPKYRKWFFLAGIVILGIVLWRMVVPMMRSESMGYRTVRVERGDVRMTVSATGTLNALVTVKVGSQVSGIIKEIYADFNSPVKKGQTIAQIDPALFEAALANAKADLENAEAQVLNKTRELAREKQLVEKELVSQSDVDKREMEHEQALAAREQALAAIKSAETNLRYTTILSPVDGIVISRDVDVGQTVASSFQAPTLFTIAKDLSQMQINASVDEADVGMIREGQDVFFNVDAYPEEIFQGKVTQVRNAPIVAQNVVHYDVIVSVKNKEMKLKPGMTAHVKIVTAAKSGVLRIPNAALRFTPEGEHPDAYRRTTPFKPGASDVTEGREATVWIYQFRKPVSRKIRIGVRDEFFTEVLEGLKQNETIVIGQITQEQKRFQKVNPLAKPGSGL